MSNFNETLNRLYFKINDIHKEMTGLLLEYAKEMKADNIQLQEVQDNEGTARYFWKLFIDGQDLADRRFSSEDIDLFFNEALKEIDAMEVSNSLKTIQNENDKYAIIPYDHPDLEENRLSRVALYCRKNNVDPKIMKDFLEQVLSVPKEVVPASWEL